MAGVLLRMVWGGEGGDGGAADTGIWPLGLLRDTRMCICDICGRHVDAIPWACATRSHVGAFLPGSGCACVVLLRVGLPMEHAKQECDVEWSMRNDIIVIIEKRPIAPPSLHREWR